MKRIISQIILILGFPFTFLSAFWLKIVKKAGTGRFGDKIFMMLGILPILDDFYQPLINPARHLKKGFIENREITCIDFNINEQLKILQGFDYNAELIKIPIKEAKEFGYFYDNDSYCSGDGEYLYNMIRYYKPKTIIEIGSGFSTLMACNAIKQNKSEDPSYSCDQTCIEPYRHGWLDNIGINIVRKKVEDVDKMMVKKLQANDILFIDSSHIIRPQGDVLFEYFSLLPELNPGVFVHIHDIFTPRDYPEEWIYDHCLWNEQYLVEALLMYNKDFRITGALNYLAHNYRKELGEKCPVFAIQRDREPGALWLVKA
ncbi:MAG TPA: class I SAM-dependent methyltransferase [Bacteroidales bacterium]|nr:class I SAM-dependent methyltransferase [Bacteroidales bacterium]